MSPPLISAVLLLICSLSMADYIYVTPYSSCNNDCTGSVTAPFDNLLDAFNLASQATSSIIILLYDSSNPHYLMDWQSSSFGGPTITKSFSVKSLTIQPLFCGVEPALSNPTLSGHCIAQTQKVVVYLKTTRFQLLFDELISIKNVVFSGVEDILNWNSYSPQVADCLYTRKRCCASGQVTSVKCSWSGDYSPLSLQVNSGLFTFNSGSTAIKSSLILENMEFRDILSPHLASIVTTSAHPFTLVIKETIIDNVYFDAGLILHKGSNTLDTNPARKNTSTITIDNLTFTNYNSWDLLSVSASRSEGYLLNSIGVYSGSIIITNSRFENTTSSLRDACWPQTNNYYAKPMNNFLKSFPRSRTDLWSQYASIRDVGFISSLIMIKQIYGALSISDCLFKNIIGTSGSVVRVDDVISSGTWFLIYNSIFDSSFAYDSFANIMIAKASDPNFLSMLDCPHFEVFNSKFSNAYGCPGTYGNVLSLCYWDPQPSSSGVISSYTTVNEILNNNLYNAWMDQSESLSNIRVTNSLFENNMLSVSNSLAFIGVYFAVLRNNTFQDNGGTTAEIAQLSLSNSYYLNRYPTAIAFPLAMTHFGQSTAVYFDHVVKLQCIDNTYQRNWGPWEVSLALGTSLTVKNWIAIDDNFQLDGDTFTDHSGIPTRLASQLSNSGLKNNNYIEPIICISIDSSNNGAPNDDSQLPRNVILKGTTFHNNIASYNMLDYNYNNLELQGIIKAIIVDDKYKSGLVRLLSQSESVDSPSTGFAMDNTIFTKSGFSLMGGQISNNRLITSGCLFIGATFLLDLKILSNEMYLQEDFVTQSSAYASLSFTNQGTDGMFCMGLKGFKGSSNRLQMTASNLFAQSNRGVILNILANLGSQGYLTDSIFVDNTCMGASIIVSNKNTNFFYINNIFVGNNNRAGNIYSDTTVSVQSIYNVYLSNTGVYSSLFLLELSYSVTEGLAKVLWNTINPQYKTFEDGLIPQGALSYLDYSIFTSFNSLYKENTGYSGLFVVSGNSLSLYNCNITGHKISGSSIFGTFLALAVVTMENIIAINNTISVDTSMPDSQPGLLVLVNSRIEMTNVEFIGGGAQTGAMLMFMNLVTGLINNMNIIDFYREEDGQAPLIYLSVSELDINKLYCSNITGLFKVADSVLSLNQVNIEQLVANYQSQYLFDMSNTNLTLHDLKYTGNGAFGSLVPFIGGAKCSVEIVDCHFINTVGGQQNMIELTNSDTLFITGTIFEYTEDSGEVGIVKITQGANVVIINSVFSFVGSIITASSLSRGFYFLQNSVITNSHMQNILLEDIENIYMHYNQFMRHNNINPSSLPNSQIQIIDPKMPFYIANNAFISLYGFYGVLDVESVQSVYSLTTKLNTFIGNTGSSGGAFYLSALSIGMDGTAPSIVIEDSVFISNKVITRGNNPGRGGVLYQTTSNQTKQKTIITNSLFIGNVASVIGGAIFFDYSPPSVSSNSVFLNNFATRPNHIGSYPVKLTQYNEANPSNITYIPSDMIPTFKTKPEYSVWADIGSGISIGNKYPIALIDMFNQIVYSDNTSTLDIYPAGFDDAKIRTFASPTSISAINGLFSMQSVSFSYMINSAIDVTFNTSAIPPFSPSPVSGLILLPNLTAKINFRSCGLGEFTISKNGLTMCQECPAKFWYLTPSVPTSACLACDLGTTICNGGNNVGPKAGYWRLNETADIVLPCPIGDTCVGNSDSTIILDHTGTCASGYVGNLCYSCIPYWAKSNANKCVSCENNILSYVLLIGVVATQVILIVFGVRETIKEGEEYEKKIEDTRADSSTLLRILMNYSQIFTLLMEVCKNWPSALSDTLSTSESIAFVNSQFFSTDCFFGIAKEALHIEIAFLKALVTALNPFITILFGVLFWLLFFRYKKRPILKSTDLTNKIMTTIIIICFDMQPEIVKKSFSFLQCTNLYRNDTPLKFLINNYDIKCWEGNHLTWTLALIIPCLFIWIFLLPAILFFTIRKHKDRLDSEEIAKKYSFVYNGYKKERFYWEFVIMIRKIILISAMVFTGFHSTNLQVYFFLILIVFSYISHALGKPYTDPVLNNLERIGLLSILIVCICGLYFQVIQGNAVLDNIAICAGGIYGFYFIVYFCWIFLPVQIQRLSKNKYVKKIANFLDKNLCCCLKRPAVKRIYSKVEHIIKIIYLKIKPILSSLLNDSPTQAQTPHNDEISQGVELSGICRELKGSNDDEEPKKTPQDQNPIFNFESSAIVTFRGTQTLNFKIEESKILLFAEDSFPESTELKKKDVSKRNTLEIPNSHDVTEEVSNLSLVDAKGNLIE